MKTEKWLRPLFFLLLVLLTFPISQGNAENTAARAAQTDVIKISEGEITIPTYEHVGRYLVPPLFPDSTISGLYPFTTYKRAWTKDSPRSEKYHAIYVENEYLKLTYIPELGGRFFALYDKLRHREVFYRNDVIKPTQFNPRFSWPQSGIELTGPYDAHTLTLHNEPFWSHVLLKNPDGSVSVMLGEVDPIYHMDVTYTATLVPGVAALKISTFCYNGNDGQKPQMMWSNAAFRVTPKLRFLYPMTQTVGHTTGVVSPWPIYDGVDLSWAHNNMHMLGVFGIDSYDNYGGSYEFDHNYGVFRYADRRVVQGMKMWTFGFGPGSKEVEESYTDHAGPYFEAQSGRMVWDGHYEWVYPHQVEQWHEWWIPVAGIDGLTTLAQDVALNLTVNPDSIEVALSPVRTIRNAHVVVKAQSGMLLDAKTDLVPGTPVLKTIQNVQTGALQNLEVTVTAPDGKMLLNYVRPEKAPGGNVTPFARDLENAPIPPEKMTAQELVLAAEFKQKDLNTADATKLARMALKIDPGYSTAHQLLGMLAFNDGHFDEAAGEFQKAVDRDPYDSQSWYYLSVCQIRMGQTAKAERNLYYIWPGSAYYGVREYQLGRLAFLRGDMKTAVQHLSGAVTANGDDLDARLLLALIDRQQGKKADALAQLTKVTTINPTNRRAVAEHYFLGDAAAKTKLVDLMGGQSEDAIEVSLFYSSLHQWKDAATVLQMIHPLPDSSGNLLPGTTQLGDPWGTPSIYFYTVAYDLQQAGDANGAAAYRKKAQAAAGVVERFPYRPQSIAPLEAAIQADPNDAVARYNLASLLYFQGDKQKAITQWAAVNRINPSDFNARRNLGLAYEEDGQLPQAVSELKKAVELRPEDLDTVDDLATAYARAGRFDEQLALLEAAVKRSPDNDHLVKGVLTADLVTGNFAAAQKIVDQHTFKPVHRNYELRDLYRELEYAQGSQAFHKGDYAKALQYFQAALKPPATMGIDDFEQQSAPRIDYYIGRTYEAMGNKAAAQQAYENSAHGVDQLAGGGRESWSPDNFFMVLSLQRLGRHAQADELTKQFSTVAGSRTESSRLLEVASSQYLRGLMALSQGDVDAGRKLIEQAVKTEPDYIAPRFELNGNAISPAEAPVSH